MRALTLHQPWAGAVAMGRKRFETRSWRTKYRGLLAVHASSYNSPEHVLLTQGLYDELGRASVCYTRGAVVAVVDLVDCVQTTSVRTTPAEQALGNFSPGRWVWVLRDLRVLRMPVFCRGRQGLWSLTPELEAKVLEQIKVTP